MSATRRSWHEPAPGASAVATGGYATAAQAASPARGRTRPRPLPVTAPNDVWAHDFVFARLSIANTRIPAQLVTRNAIAAFSTGRNLETC